MGRYVAGSAGGGSVTAGLVSAAAVAGLGLPALGALVLVAFLVLAVACWVVSSQARTDRVTQILRAWRGISAQERAPAAPAAGASVYVSAGSGHRSRWSLGKGG